MEKFVERKIRRENPPDPQEVRCDVRQDEDLKIVRASTVSSINGVTARLVRARVTRIRLSDDVAITAYVSISES